MKVICNYLICEINFPSLMSIPISSDSFLFSELTYVRPVSGAHTTMSNDQRFYKFMKVWTKH